MVLLPVWFPGWLRRQGETKGEVMQDQCRECAEGLGYDEARHSCGEPHPDTTRDRYEVLAGHRGINGTLYHVYDRRDHRWVGGCMYLDTAAKFCEKLNALKEALTTVRIDPAPFVPEELRDDPPINFVPEEEIRERFS